MRSPLVILALLFSVPLLRAQDATDQARDKAHREEAAKAHQDSLLGWRATAVTGLTLSQISLKDWAPGGEDAFSYGIYFSGSATSNAEQTKWANRMKIGYGQTKLGDKEFRKTDDELDFESLLIYKMGVTINPYVSATLRTQLAPGYAYSGDTSKTEISAFFDPAYLTQSAGVAYTPIPELTTRLGAGLREVLTSRHAQYADDPETKAEVEKTRIQGGLESVTDLSWTFAENMQLTSRLELFAPFKEIDRIIVRNDNIVTARVNQYVSVNLNLQLVNDVNVSARTQVKQTLAIGVSYTLL